MFGRAGIFLVFNILSSSPALHLPLWVISAAYMALTVVITVALLLLWSANIADFNHKMSGVSSTSEEPDSAVASSGLGADVDTDPTGTGTTIYFETCFRA